MQAEQPISFWTAIARGLVCRCPNCGEGKLFRSFLKVNNTCPHCSEELYHHRADDLPAYIVILIAGHVIVPLVAYVEIEYGPSYWVHAALWLPLCLLICVGLLQPMKGLVVAIQWVNGMHDFMHAKVRRAAKFALPTATEEQN